MSATDAVDRRGNRDAGDVTNISEDMPAAEEKRRRVDDLPLAVILDEGAVKGRAQTWNPAMEAPWNAANAPPFAGVDAAMLL